MSFSSSGATSMTDGLTPVDGQLSLESGVVEREGKVDCGIEAEAIQVRASVNLDSCLKSLHHHVPRK